jgi:hypothetical protein
MCLCLSNEELHSLTGYQKPSRQIAWLRAEGFIFRIAADGHPRVDRSHYMKLMGGIAHTAQQKRTEPNFFGLLKSNKGA